MNKNLYILPFDHRSSFFKNILGVKGKPSEKNLEQARELKEMIFNGFVAAIHGFKDKKSFGILVDESMGKSIIARAKKEKIILCLPVEKSGHTFDFEYGKKFKEHIDKNRPDFVKALIRYNPENIAENKKQLSKLAELETFCKKKKYKLIIELLVPPTENDLKVYGEKKYEQKVRAAKTIKAIEEIQAAGSPDIWKLEGFSKPDWPQIIKAVKKSKIIVLGRGESTPSVIKWLEDASTFKEIIGFAVGRTVFSEALISYLDGDISKNEASLWIAIKFSFFVNLWQEQKNNSL
jgi:5-dehydro-2-deoxygluconokinase